MSRNTHIVDISELLERDAHPSQKVVILLNLPEIEKALALGYTKKKIYDLLVSEKVIDCSYAYFGKILLKNLTPQPTKQSSVPFGEDDLLDPDDLI